MNSTGENGAFNWGERWLLPKKTASFTRKNCEFYWGKCRVLLGRRMASFTRENGEFWQEEWRVLPASFTRENGKFYWGGWQVLPERTESFTRKNGKFYWGGEWRVLVGRMASFTGENGDWKSVFTLGKPPPIEKQDEIIKTLKWQEESCDKRSWKVQKQRDKRW